MKMREIKFRAWEQHGKRMIGWHDIAFPKSGSSARLCDHPLRHASDESCIFKYLQYTGLKDKNGKEIYEGDIVELHCSANEDNVVTATITWNDEIAKFDPAIHDKEMFVTRGTYAGKMKNMREVHSWCGLHHCFSFPNRLKVIGNIYENPELLEVTRGE
jgi:uncharacterized phage protein (TIGR01671 family)